MLPLSSTGRSLKSFWASMMRVMPLFSLSIHLRPRSFIPVREVLTRLIRKMRRYAGAGGRASCMAASAISMWRKSRSGRGVARLVLMAFAHRQGGQAGGCGVECFDLLGGGGASGGQPHLCGELGECFP